MIDHVIPLKRGGPDSPDNMQWQTREAAKAKDRNDPEYRKARLAPSIAMDDPDDVDRLERTGRREARAVRPSDHLRQPPP